MTPVRFKFCNSVFAQDQPEYSALPAHCTEDGIVTTCWELTREELAEVQRSGRIWFSQLTFNSPLQPMLPQAFDPFRVEQA